MPEADTLEAEEERAAVLFAIYAPQTESVIGYP
jgi:hypothetical protein